MAYPKFVWHFTLATYLPGIEVYTLFLSCQSMNFFPILVLIKIIISFRFKKKKLNQPLVYSSSIFQYIFDIKLCEENFSTARLKAVLKKKKNREKQQTQVCTRGYKHGSERWKRKENEKVIKSMEPRTKEKKKLEQKGGSSKRSGERQV